MPTHDEVCESAVQAVAAVDSDAVVAAFVSSLRTRNLPARSAFGSYQVLQRFARHAFAPSVEFPGSGGCAYCGLSRTVEADTDARVQAYPFQVQHTDIAYAAFDLASFGRRATDPVHDADRILLGQLIDALRALPAEAQLEDLRKAATLPGFKANKHQRTILLESLGYAGILCPRTQRCYADAFVAFDRRIQPAHVHKREWDYPLRFWEGRDGVDEEAVVRWFGEFL